MPDPTSPVGRVPSEEIAEEADGTLQNAFDLLEKLSYELGLYLKPFTEGERDPSKAPTYGDIGIVASLIDRLDAGQNEYARVVAALKGQLNELVVAREDCAA